MKRANTPITSDQAVSVVIGALLIVSIMMIAAVQYQNNVIPAQEEATEIQHNREVRGQLHHLRSNIIATASSGQLRTTPVDVGTQFEQQFIFGFLPAVQSPNPQGTLETYNVSNDKGTNITITGADGRSGANNYWQASESYEYTTSFLNYSIDYAQSKDSPKTIYENTVLYDVIETESGTNYAVQSNQNLVDGNNINLVTMTGEIDSTTTSTVNVQTRPVSAPAQTVVVKSPPSDEGGPLTITIPTELPPSEWCSLPSATSPCNGGDGAGMLNDEMISNGGFIQGFDYLPSGKIQLEFQADETFTMKMSRVHLQTQQDQSLSPNLGAKYVAWQGSDRITFRENTRHTISAQVRDKYNNPVPGIDTVAVAKDANNNDNCVGDFVSGTLGGISECPDNRQPGERTSGENGEVTYFYDTPTVEDDTSINLQIELANNSSYAAFDAPNFALSPSGSYAAQSIDTQVQFDLDGESNIDTDGDGDGERTFRVLETKLNTSQVVAGKNLQLSVLLDNTGLEDKNANLDPDVIDASDGSTATSATVSPSHGDDSLTVGPGEQVRYSYKIHFNKTGTYNISLNGTDITKQVEVVETSSTIYDGTIQSAVENQSVSKVITSYKDEVEQSNHPAYNPSIPPVVETSNGSFKNSADGLVYDFGNAQSPNDQSLTLEGTDGELNVGTAFENVPQQQYYTIQLNYNISGNTDVEMMVVTQNGEVIDEDTQYLLDGETDTKRQTKYFTLSQEETEYVQNHKNIYLVYSADGEPVVDIYYTQAISSTDLLSISTGNTKVTDLTVKDESGATATDFEEYEPITISVSKTNTGTSSVERNILLEQNGQTIDTKEVTINPGETRTVNFVKYRQEGIYEFSSENAGNTVVTVGEPSGDGNRAPYARITTDMPTINNRYVPTGSTVGDDTGADFTLDASESIDPNGDTLSYEWEVTNTDTGNTFTQTGSTLTDAAFSSKGNYTISLFVYDGNGGDDRIDRKLALNSIPPTALYTIDPIPIPNGTTATFNASIARDADGNIQTYTWSVDGVEKQNSSNPYFEKSFSTTGYHDVTLKTTDDDGNVKIQQQNVEVFASSVSASFSYSPSNPSTETQVLLNASDSQATDGSITDYEWTDGSGELLGTGEKITHTFSRTGDISVTLEVTTDNGKTASTTKVIPVSAPFDAEIYTDKTSASPGVTFNLNAYNSTDENSLIEEYQWNMGDGTVYTGPQQYHDYDEAGAYEVTLTARGNGYTSTDTVVIDIESDAPVAVANFNTTVNLGQAVSLYGENSYHPSGSIVGYNWNLGNGDTATTQNVVDYAYTEPTLNPGSERLRQPYNATLTVSDQDGEIDTDYVIVDVENRGPVALTTANYTRLDNGNYGMYSGDTIEFDASNSYHIEAPHASITEYEWLEDGTLQTNGMTLTKSYTTPGEYNITLRVTDSYGATDQNQTTLEVWEMPTAVIGVNRTDARINEPIQFDGSASVSGGSDSTTIEEYRWDFDGDGTYEQTTNTETTVYSYNNDGTYNPQLQIVNSDGKTDTTSSGPTVTITNPTNPKHINYTIENPTSKSTTNYQVNLTVDKMPEMRSDYGDVRFKQNGNYLDYHLRSYTTDTAKFVVELDQITADGATVNMTYGNTDLTTQSNPEETYVVYDYHGNGMDDGVFYNSSRDAGSYAELTPNNGVGSLRYGSVDVGIKAKYEWQAGTQADSVSLVTNYQNGTYYHETGQYGAVKFAVVDHYTDKCVTVNYAGNDQCQKGSVDNYNQDTNWHSAYAQIYNEGGDTYNYYFDSGASGAPILNGTISAPNAGNQIGFGGRTGGAYNPHNVRSITIRKYLGEEVSSYPGQKKQTIGETGEVDVYADDGSYQTVNLDNTYDNPVVIAKSIGPEGSQPAHSRVRNVQSDSFQITVEEWPYQDGPHSQNDFAYVVMEAGNYSLPNGGHIEAGTTSTDNYYTSVSFKQSFSSTPVVFTQSQTENDGDSIITRNRYVTTSGFDTRLQESEAHGGHSTETIGYIAVSDGNHETSNGVQLEVDTTANTVTENRHSISFDYSYDSTRAALIDAQTEDGGNTANIRYENFYSGSIDVWMEEEQSSDTEEGHTTEQVGYMVYDEFTDLVLVTENNPEPDYEYYQNNPNNLDFWQSGTTDYSDSATEGGGPTGYLRYEDADPPPGESGYYLEIHTQGDAGNEERNGRTYAWTKTIDLTGVSQISFNREILQYDRHAYMGVLIGEGTSAATAYDNRGTSSSDYYENPCHDSSCYFSGYQWDEMPGSNPSDEYGGTNFDYYSNNRVYIDVSGYSGEQTVMFYGGHRMYWYEDADSYIRVWGIKLHS